MSGETGFSPWENGYLESFHGKLRNSILYSLNEATYELWTTLWPISQT